MFSALLKVDIIYFGHTSQSIKYCVSLTLYSKPLVNMGLEKIGLDSRVASMSS